MTGPNRRQALVGAATTLAMPFAFSSNASCSPANRTGLAVFRPETYGARGDGVTNDTDAFSALSAAVQAAGGGVIELGARKTYLVGKNGRPAPGQWRNAPSKILEFERLTTGLTIQGNGARIKCAPGMRFGSFDGAAKPTSGINTMRANRSSPYLGMIYVLSSAGDIHIVDVELDGSLEEVIVGGEWGDTGRQIQMNGVYIIDCSGAVSIRNVYAHHHGLDGLQIGQTVGSEDAKVIPGRVDNFRSEYNGRQGLSLIGGRSITFTDCRFAFTGRSKIASKPSAGIDVESEGQLIRDITFINCETIDTAGVGILFEGGDTKRVTLRNCRFINGYNWSAWTNEPGVTYVDCLFAGSAVHAWGTPGGLTPDSTRWIRCTFSDDASLSPSAKLGGGTWALDAGGGPEGEFLLEECVFDLRHGKKSGPYIRPGTAIFRNCRIRTHPRSTPAPINGYIEGMLRYDGVDWLSGPVRRPGARLIYQGVEQN